MRLKDVRSLANKKIKRNRKRFLLTVTPISIFFALVISIVTVSASMKASVLSSAHSASEKAYLKVVYYPADKDSANDIITARAMELYQESHDVDKRSPLIDNVMLNSENPFAKQASSE